MNKNIEKLKKFLNLKNDKNYKIIILSLSIIIILMQTSLVFKNNSIKSLKSNINSLNKELNILQTKTKLNYNQNEIKKVDEKLNNDINYSDGKKKLINKLKELASKENKNLKSNLKSDNKKLIFETLDLNLTDNQIKSLISNISQDEFNIEITENNISDTIFFKIFLIEKSIK